MVVLARQEAQALKHGSIGTEHILLGLFGQGEGLAGRVLESLDITPERVRERVVEAVGTGQEEPPQQIPFTAQAKQALELALREALNLGHNYIGTEHILLGLACENEGLAARILLDFGAGCEKIRSEVMRGLSGRGAQIETGASPAPQGEADPAEPGATSPVRLPDLGGMSDSELDGLIEALLDEERAIVDRRRVLQGTLDILRREREKRLCQRDEPAT